MGSYESTNPSAWFLFKGSDAGPIFPIPPALRYKRRELFPPSLLRPNRKSVEDIGRIRDAKIFLASRIAEEADRGGIPFSETERKMLYDSTGGWTLPDIEEVRE